MLTTVRKQPQKPVEESGKGKNYNEVIALLNVLPQIACDKSAAERVKQLDLLCGNPSKGIDVVLVGGTNGKSSTIHFAAKLLHEEGYKVGYLLSSHFLAFNERLYTNNQPINNKKFAEAASVVLETAQSHKVSATAFEIMLVTAMIHFKSEGITVALFEVGAGGKLDATTAFNPTIAAITRVAEGNKGYLATDLDEAACEMMGIARKNSWVVSAEQSKLRLQKMKTFAEANGFRWAMPIRKLAPLPYIYEQLFGRSASLGERIAQIYIEDVKGKFSPFLRGNLLATQRGQRGRPTLEAKRQAELNPIKTLKGFWSNQFELPHGRFEILDKEKPTTILDNASNFDALSNLFLGIRLLHYSRPLKNAVVILGLKKDVNTDEVLKLARYLLKRISGELLFVPLPNDAHYEPAELTKQAHTLNLKATSCPTLKDALEIARSKTDERSGIIALAGSTNLIAEYWKSIRELKKL